MLTRHNLSHVMCHMSCVTCHMSCVTCHVSRVTCHVSHVTLLFFFSRTKWWSISMEGLLSTGPRLSSFKRMCKEIQKLFNFAYHWVYQRNKGNLLNFPTFNVLFVVLVCWLFILFNQTFTPLCYLTFLTLQKTTDFFCKRWSEQGCT